MRIPTVKSMLLYSPPAGWVQILVRYVPGLSTLVNRFMINQIASACPPRPLAMSTWGPKNSPPPPPPPAAAVQEPSAAYVSWTGLVDRRFTGRHLPAADDAYMKRLPAVAALMPVLARGHTMVPCPKSSALFCFFAQWFTDSFLRTDPADLRRNTSNHEIDLCQVYGLIPEDTLLLRTLKDGLLKTEGPLGHDYPPRLYEPDGDTIRAEFIGLSYVDQRTNRIKNSGIDPVLDIAERRRELFAVGLERGNSTIFYSALNTLFLREHNRLCREMKARGVSADDDELFELARSTNIAQLIKLIVEDYINHISGTGLRFSLDVGFADRQRWYRTNRISIEFGLLYRWHSLVPDTVVLDGKVVPAADFRFNNALLRQVGVGAVLADGSAQRAGRIMLGNTPSFLMLADQAAMDKSRAWRLRPFNEYCRLFGMTPLTEFEQLSEDPAIVRQLQQLYKFNIEDVELLPGLFGERRRAGSVLAPMMGLMVGADAFSHALTNPLLAKHVFGRKAFSATGLATIARTAALDDVAQRNCGMDGRSACFTVPA